MTVCNMSIEAGARAGMIAPDDTTFAYLDGRPFAPQGRAMGRGAGVLAQPCRSDDGRRCSTARSSSKPPTSRPMVTWGTNPEHALPITGASPIRRCADRRQARTRSRQRSTTWASRRACALTDIAVDRVFIGSCTNARIEDLRAAADVARLGRAAVPAVVVPGSTPVKRQAEAEGLDRIFTAAGFEWRDAGCSLCTALNGDLLAPRRALRLDLQPQFPRPPGPNGRTHLMSPAMAAAAALTGRLTDVRTLLAASAEPWNRSARSKAIAVPLDEVNIDTNQLCPTRFNKVPRGTGLRAHPVPRPALRRQTATRSPTSFSIASPIASAAHHRGGA